MFKLACACALAALASSSRVSYPAASHIPAGWRNEGPSPQDAVVPLMFAMRQRNVDVMMAELDAVSTPTSPSYGKHWSLAQLKELMHDAEATATLHSFLSSFPILSTRSTINEEFITVRVTVAIAEAMLQAEYSQWVNVASGEMLHRVPSYSLPSHVAPAVEFVLHTVNLPHAVSHTVITGYSATATGVATPAVVLSYYGITNNVLDSIVSTNSVFETLQQSFAPADVQTFDKTFNVKGPKDVNVVGFNDPSSCSNVDNCIEAELDVQLITAIAQGSNTTFWSVPSDESFFQWISAVASTGKPPLVHSISYGEYESAGQSQRFDEEVAKLGLRGVSVLTSSGDDGVAGNEARSNPAGCGFNPQYPASAPHVTTVGATQGPEDKLVEVTCQSDKGGVISSGGGFSNIFGRPAYQDKAVKAYFANPDAKLPPAAMWNASGRAYPDVALMGHNFPIVAGGVTYYGSGTSASSPLFAGIVTLANAARIKAGKSPLGFLNPVLYSLPETVFHDITIGENNCAAANSNPTCCQYGFTATRGWDATTGLGSIAFPAFLKAVSALP